MIVEHELITDWINRKVDDLVFVETIGFDDEVICAHIPQEIRDILQAFKEMRQREVFYKAFCAFIGEAAPGPFTNVAGIYKKALTTYEEICYNFNIGQCLASYI